MSKEDRAYYRAWTENLHLSMTAKYVGPSRIEVTVRARIPEAEKYPWEALLNGCVYQPFAQAHPGSDVTVRADVNGKTCSWPRPVFPDGEDSNSQYQ